MKIQQQVRRSPEAEPVAGVSVRVVREADGATLAVAASDADGFVAYQADGSPGAVALIIAGLAGGTKTWASADAMSAGPVCLPEVPYALRTLGDGVVRGVLDELAVSAGAGDAVTLATGAALVAGLPVVNYAPDSLPFTRPVSSTRHDRVIIRVDTDDGEALFALLPGTEGGSAPSLTQTASTYEIALATVAIPVVAPITIADERAYAGERPDASGVARTALVTTTSGSGEALAGLSLTLDLPRAVTYDIAADLTARQTDTAAVLAWAVQNQYGSAGSGNGQFSAPGQVAVDSSGNVYVADPGNNRLQKLSSGGVYQSSITGLTAIGGVAVDSSGNVYVSYQHAARDWRIRKYDSAFVLQWTTVTLTTALSDGLGHLATDGSNLFVTYPFANAVGSRLCSTGASVWFVSGTGSGNGQYRTPAGVVVSGSSLFVVDSGNSRVQQLATATGAYVAQWPIAAGGRGIAVDGSGRLLVAESTAGVVTRYSSAGTFVDRLTQTGATGLAVASGDVVWVTSPTAAFPLNQWDEANQGGGFGSVAIEIDGSVGTYLSSGQGDNAVHNVAAGSKAGPGSVLIRAFGTAAGTMTLRSAVLTARAVARG